MRTARRALTVAATAAAATLLLGMQPAAAAAPEKHTYSSSGVYADATFSNAPADGNLTVGKVYTDVFVHANDETGTFDGQPYSGDSVYVDAWSYKLDRRGNFVDVSSSFGFASADKVDFTGDAARLSTASVSAVVDMQTCNARGCKSAGTSNVTVTWTGSGATTTHRSSFRSSTPGQFSSNGHFSGTSRGASATGTVPVLGQSSSVHASIGSGTWTDRTICHAC